jgi:hypothetical protein
MTWDDYPLTLTMRQVAEIFGINEQTVRKRVVRCSPLIPPPSFIRPYAWRREDVKRFYETASVEGLRRAIAQHERSA